MQTIRRHWRIIFPIIIAIIIWGFSAQSGEVSDAESLRYANSFGISNIAMRKIAHIILFGAFGYSICSYLKGLYSYIFPTYSLVVYAAVVGVIYGAIDEVHQLAVVGRSALISDVFIDALGAICGILIYIIIFCFWRLLWNLKLKQKIAH